MSAAETKHEQDNLFYLLAQTWAPTHCCEKPTQCSAVPWAFSANHLTLHGLWPAYYKQPSDTNQKYPQNCHAKVKLLSQFLPREYIDLAPAFTKWNMQLHQAEVGELAKHEWKKHGTCSGLTPEGYFQEALRAMQHIGGDRGTPKLLTNNSGGKVKVEELRSQYAKKVAIRADKYCRLTEVTTCWKRLSDGRVGPMTDCPDSTMQGRDGTRRCSFLHLTAVGKCNVSNEKVSK